MEERTADEVAAIFAAAGDSVTVINGTKDIYETDAEWKEKVKRNVEHLETIKAYKKLDETTSIWTTENFTAIDAAITKGKTIYGG
jgi:pyruvate/2-oxoglutarate dehydrogenase complex dihydrolipoamide dehydrogenase (E3) component|tara:strand:+ start:262 stop:516 length:255 start_codon:yes stop_codon:yes gene_type:complete